MVPPLFPGRETLDARARARLPRGDTPGLTGAPTWRGAAAWAGEGARLAPVWPSEHACGMGPSGARESVSALIASGVTREPSRASSVRRDGPRPVGFLSSPAHMSGAVPFDIVARGPPAPTRDGDRRRPARRPTVPAGGPVAGAPGPAVRRRPQRGRRSRAGGLHPPRPLGASHQGRVEGRRVPPVDRAEPRPRQQPARPRLAAPPPPARRCPRRPRTRSSCAKTSAR